jgi:UDP-GlcNAc:undecaprenyl-phosphate/decaprenyl-phosphate GlcNAc-1-phosphate transferase
MFHLLVLMIALLASAVATKLIFIGPFVKYFGDAPNHRKVHQHVVPRLGGLGMILGFLLVLGLRSFVPADFWPRSGNFFSGALLFVALFLSITGTLDDIRPLNFKLKFLFQFILATGIVVLLGHKFDDVSALGHHFQLGHFGYAITIFWIVAVMNAFNIIDGIDGLAGGVAICGFGAVGWMAYSNGSMYLLAMATAFIGLTLGFLRFNLSSRSKVFLGDSGSQFLGAVLALFAIEVQVMPMARHSVFVPLLIVGYPLFDISVAMVRRFIKGGSRSLGKRFVGMFAADNEHLHHRLVYLGLSHVQSAFLLILVAGTLAASAIVISRLGIPGRIGALAYLAAALFLILNRLGYIGIRPWLTFPRSKPMPDRIIGVIEPDELFFHSLQSFKQDRFEFLSMTGKLSKFLGEDLVAVMLYNAMPDRFDEQYNAALRATEYHDRPAIVIAESRDIERIKSQNADGFKSIHFMSKPVRVPELIRELEKFTKVRATARQRPRERRFSLAELALRNNARS